MFRLWQCFTYIGFSLAASKKDLPGWRIGLNWLCGVEMDDGDGVTVVVGGEGGVVFNITIQMVPNILGPPIRKYDVSTHVIPMLCIIDFYVGRNILVYAEANFF